MPRRGALAAAIALGLALLPGAAVGHSGLVLRGYGTAVVDGALGAGEWDPAARFDFNANRPAEEGGGTVPATLYLMNDMQNLYVGLRVDSVSTAGRSSFLASFDNNHSGGVANQQGDETLAYERTGMSGEFQDLFVRLISAGFELSKDMDYGGTSDGGGDYMRTGSSSFFELSHPLNTGDDSHDFSLVPGMRIGLDLYYIHCISSPCANTRFPPLSADLAIVSGSRIPPETQITGGPAEGSVVGPRDDLEVSFVGTDDAVSAEFLTFECSIDESAYAPCSSPTGTRSVDGAHSFAVRATDEAGLTDPTAAERHWRVDGRGPSRPKIAGPRSTKRTNPAFRFSARDATTRARQIRFRCAFDSTRLHVCRTRYSQRLRSGRHVLRVKALDRFGNASKLATARVVVKRARG